MPGRVNQSSGSRSCMAITIDSRIRTERCATLTGSTGARKTTSPAGSMSSNALPSVAAVAVRVEAKGYKPATSEPFRMHAGDVRFDARLEPGVGPSGVVHGLDGRPLAGARVILSTKSLRAQLYNGKFHEGAYPQALTGADGRFSFPAPAEPFRVFVDHESGFAEADEKTVAASSHLTVKPWGRIEGTVKIGSRLAAGVQIRLSETDNHWDPADAVPIMQSQQLNTDARGHYAFERESSPPGSP